MARTVEGTARQVRVSAHIDAFAFSERRSEFMTRVAKSVQRVLDTLFGSVARQSVFLHIAMTREVAQWDIVDKPALFMEGLRGIFGDSALPLEAAIVDELRREFGLELPLHGESLRDVLNRASRASPKSPC